VKLLSIEINFRLLREIMFSGELNLVTRTLVLLNSIFSGLSMSSNWARVVSEIPDRVDQSHVRGIHPEFPIASGITMVTCLVNVSQIRMSKALVMVSFNMFVVRANL
jgi:hypothetical protein